MFELGFSTLGCPSHEVGQVIALARDNRFVGVELRFLRGEVDLPKLEELSPAGVRETRRRFEDAGVQVVCIASGVRLNSPDPEERRWQLASVRAHCEIAEALGAPYLRVFGGPIPEYQDTEATLDAIAAGLSRAAGETSARGVTTLLETPDAFATSDRVLDLFVRGAGGALGILWDTLHT